MAAAESDEQAIGDVEEIVAADIEIIPLLVDFADVVIVLENRVAAGVNRCAAVRFGERLEIGKTRGVHPAGRNDVSGERSPGDRKSVGEGKDVGLGVRGEAGLDVVWCDLYGDH